MNQEKAEQFKTYFKQLLDDSGRQGQGEQKWTVFNLGRVSTGDDGDRASDEREKALTLRLKARSDFYRKKIMKALNKIERGEFGDCEECGAEIGEERLEARPTATMCINCKEEQEQKEGQIPYRKRSHTFGQEIVSNAGQSA